VERQALRRIRRDLQIVFQDPLASLDPRMSIGESIAEPLRAFRAGFNHTEREAECRAMMARVDLDEALINRYPHELSGGQNQRVGIARAMILKPRLVVCDEAVSALDVTIRAQVIDLLIGLQKDLGLAMIFISHDLAVVRELSHRVLVLYQGRVVELGAREALFDDPRHPYTRALLAAALTPDPTIERARAKTGVAALERDAFDPQAITPELVEIAPEHFVAAFAPAWG
jgi:ABC-type microcin C transport system duplicated ATPase subunit YejF